jgi:hypothetical protein
MTQFLQLVIRECPWHVHQCQIPQTFTLRICDATNAEQKRVLIGAVYGSAVRVKNKLFFISQDMERLFNGRGHVI